MQVEVLNWFRALLSAGWLVPFCGRLLCCPPEARTTSDLWSKCCCWKWDANTFATILKKVKFNTTLTKQPYQPSGHCCRLPASFSHAMYTRNKEEDGTSKKWQKKIDSCFSIAKTVWNFTKKKVQYPAKKHRNVQIPNKYKSIIKAGPKLGFEKLD